MTIRRPGALVHHARRSPRWARPRPGVLGALVGDPTQPAIAVIGDGAFNMTSHIVAAAVEYDLPAVWVISQQRRAGDRAQGVGSACSIARIRGCGSRARTPASRTTPTTSSLPRRTGPRRERVEDPNELARRAASARSRARRPYVLDVPSDTGAPDLLHAGARPLLSQQLGRDVPAIHRADGRRRMTSRTAVRQTNFIAGEWREGAAGRTYELRNPFGHADVVGEFPASDERDVDDAVAAASDAAGAWSRCRRSSAASILFRAAEIDRRPLRGDRRRHDPGDGQAAPRGAGRGRARGGHVALLRRRGVEVSGRDLQPQRDRQSDPGSAPSTRRRRADLPLELPVLDPAVEGRACARVRKLRGAQGGARGARRGPAPRGVPRGGRDFQRACSTSSSGGAQTSDTPLVGHPGRARDLVHRLECRSASRIRDEAIPLGKRVQLELGGHSPLVVMADADLPRAAEAAYAGAFWSAGQKCTATRRIYVHDGVYDELQDAASSRGSSGGSSAIPPTPTPRSAR